MFKNIVFSGASMKIVCLLGAYTYLKSKDVVNDLVNFVGSSAGALLAFMLASGLTPQRMKQILYDAIDQYKTKDIDISNIFNIYTSLGIDDASAIETVIRRLFNEKFHVDDMTFLEFAKSTGKNLIICVSNISKNKSEYWCLDNTPHMSITKALKASIAIPIIFKPIIHDGDVYCDGAIFDHFPLKGLTEYIGTIKFQNTIGVCFQDFGEDICPGSESINIGELNLVNYMSMLICSLLKNINNDSFVDADKNNIIISIPKAEEINTKFDWSTLKFNINRDDFLKLFQHGYKTAENNFTLSPFEQKTEAV